VQTDALLREARHAAGLTQVELARRATTVQSAIAAYESGARRPNLVTLERLLDACGYDVDVVVQPRVRRGATSLADIALAINGDLAAGEEAGARRLLFGFADDFRGSSRPGQAALIANEPAPTGHAGFDAALAGMAEFFGAESGIRAPAWVNGRSRFAVPWWFVASRPAFHAYTLANTPALFVRHGVFIAREVFDRA